MSQAQATTANVDPANKGNRQGPQDKNFKKEDNFNKNNGNQEEFKGAKGPFKHRPNKPHYEKFVVTLETEIPDLPKKNEMLPKPDDDVFQNDLDKIQKEIDDCFKKRADVAKESRNKSYLPADKTFEDLISLLKVKQEERRKAYDEFQAIMTERDMYKKQVDEYYTKGNDYRFKMKIPGAKKDLEAQLKELKNKQSKGSITLQEEKLLIKQISDYERSLPFAGPLEELEEQSKEIKELLKGSKAKTSVKFEALKLLREECKDIQDKIDKMREEHDKKKEETTPAIDKMKEEYSSKIDTLKQKKKDMFNNHNEAWRKYEDQQAEIEKIKIMKRKKEKLVRDDIRRKRDEEWRKQKEQEAAENKEVPYLTQIELCELLIKYCNRLNPANNETNTVVSQKDKNTVIEEAKQNKDWKEAKGEYIFARKEKADDFFTGKGKKKVQKKVTNKPQEEAGAQPLNHQIETLNYFEEIKVAPPLFTDKLADTLKVLQEKKAYFEKLSEEAIQADESRKTLPEEERKRLEEEDKQKRNAENQPKKEERKHKPKKFDIESEQDFPKM